MDICLLYPFFTYTQKGVYKIDLLFFDLNEQHIIAETNARSEI